MALNRGKELEEKIKEALEKFDKKELCFQRLYDITMGYKNIKNPSDFIAYKKPTHFYIECKSTKGNTLNFHDISQLDDLADRSITEGVRAGVIIWYIEHKETYWVDIRYILDLRDKLFAKSVNIKNLRTLELPNDLVFKIDGITKRVFTDYDLKSFFDYYTQKDKKIV